MQNNPLFDFLPLLVFFLVYFISRNIFIATGSCIAASWLQVLLVKIYYHKVNGLTWLSTILITILGGITLVLHDKTFVMLKPTALFWLVAVSMLIAQFSGRNALKMMLGKELDLPNKAWNRLSFSWIIFFLILGGLNLFVAFYFSEYFWVKFKVFGVMLLTLVFSLLSGLYILFAQKKAAKGGSWGN